MSADDGARTGAELLAACLAEEGVPAVVGNPGNSELPAVAAVSAAGDLPFYLALHEAVAVGMAVGVGLATGRPGVAQLHAAPGLGNAMGNLYNAWRARSPLVALVGQQDTRVALDDPLLHADLVRLAEPYAKWARQLERADEIPQGVRRAVKEATTPPHRPSVLAVPHQVQSENTSHREPLTPMPSPRPGPPAAEAVTAAVDVLARARAPAIVVGDGVDRAGCQRQVVDLAHRLGARVWAEAFGQQLSYPPDDPLFAGFLPRNAPLTRQELGDADVVLLAGAEGTLFIPPYEPGAPFPAEATTVQLVDAPEQAGERHPVDVPLVGDVEAGLVALADGLEPGVAHGRDAVAKDVTASHRAAWEEAQRARREPPIAAPAAFAALSPVLADRVVVDEAVSLTWQLRRFFPHGPPRERYGNRTGGLGWGLPAALGVAVARPGEPVVCVSGDGAALYAPQALWTAARYRLPVTVVVLDNEGYDINRLTLRPHLPEGHADELVGCDVTHPSVDWASLAAGLGVPAHHVGSADELADVVAHALAQDGPSLVRVPIARAG